MLIPEPIRREAEAKIAAFCERRTPPEARGQMRLEHAVRSGHARCRAAPVRRGVGYMEPAGSDERWHRYEDLEPTTDPDVLLQEIDEDPAFIFWG